MQLEGERQKTAEITYLEGSKQQERYRLNYSQVLK